jgi:hypothetical protein
VQGVLAVLGVESQIQLRGGYDQTTTGKFSFVAVY